MFQPRFDLAAKAPFGVVVYASNEARKNNTDSVSLDSAEIASGSCRRVRGRRKHCLNDRTDFRAITDDHRRLELTNLLDQIDLAVLDDLFPISASGARRWPSFDRTLN